MAAGAVAGWALTRDRAEPAAPPAAGVDGPVLEVLIDAWSLATLGERDLVAVQDGRSLRVDLRPVTAGEVGDLLGTTPQVVRAAAARVVTGATDLDCDEDGCTAGGVTVDLGALWGAGGPGWDLLAGHGVDAGLYRAVVGVDADGGPVTFRAGDWDGPTVPPAGQVVAGDDPGADPAPADLGNGMQQGRWLLAAGLGRVFVPDPAWLGAPEDRGVHWPQPAGVAPVDAAAVLTARAEETTAWSGLGVALPVAQRWSASQLTLATSPTKGCAAGVLCYPGVARAQVSALGRQVAPVAGADGSTGVVVLDDVMVRVDLPAPVRQAGVDGLLQGRVELRGVTASLFAGQDLVPVDWAGLVEPGDRAEYSLADVLGNVRLAGQSWSQR